MNGPFFKAAACVNIVPRSGYAARANTLFTLFVNSFTEQLFGDLRQTRLNGC